MEFIVTVGDNLYEISELVTKISFTDKLNDGCSKLEFSFVDDDLNIVNGGNTMFKYDDTGIFNGFIFKHGGNKKKEVSVTAYDQLRYCKAKDIVVTKSDTVTSLAKRMCTYFGLKYGTLTDTGYILPTSVQDNKTWIDIIYTGISDTLVNKGKKYALRDEFGAITLRDLETLHLDLILGDESLVYDYNYSKSIDDEFYNQIKLYIKDEKAQKSQIVGAKDENSIKKYGALQYFEIIDKDSNAAQAKSKADMLLSLYNRETETLTLECLGDTRVRAGSSFYGLIGDIDLNRKLIVKEVTHNFIPNHTMSLEVSI